MGVLTQKILNVLGAIVRWMYGTIWRSIANKPKYTFSEYLYGPKSPKDWFDQHAHEFVNTVIGLFTLVLVAWMLVHVSRTP